MVGRLGEDRFKIHSSKPEGPGNSCFMKKVSLFYMKSEPKLLDVFSALVNLLY